MKTKSKISAYILRGSAAALLVSCVIVALSSALSPRNKRPKLPAAQDNTAFGVNAQESAADGRCSQFFQFPESFRELRPRNTEEVW